MSTGKRYYWLKLKEDFFRSKRIKKLRNMAGGDTYTIIYLKMQLLAMKTDGILKWTGLEENFAEELALDLDEKPTDVEVTLLYLLKNGLAETEDNVNFFLPYAVENTGSEGASAQRVREFRERQSLQGNAPLLQSNTDETHVKQICNGEKEIEKEIEIETEIETEKENKRKKSFTPPTREEVREYAAQRASGVDPDRFYDYFSAGDWKDSEGKPVRNWKQKFITWESKGKDRKEPKKTNNIFLEMLMEEKNEQL